MGTHVRKKYPKGFWGKRASDFGDDPSIKGGIERKKVAKSQWGEVSYAKIKAKTMRRPKILQIINHQSGTRKDLRQDRMRKALPPSKRMSKNGNIYYETRRNRSDLVSKKY